MGPGPRALSTTISSTVPPHVFRPASHHRLSLSLCPSCLPNPSALVPRTPPSLLLPSPVRVRLPLPCPSLHETKHDN